MNIQRMSALALRHLYPLRRDFDLLSDMIYWPIIDIILWGITSQWISESSGTTTILASILLGLVIWNVMWRSQAEVSRNLMDEIWNNNLINIFSTPLTLREWVTTVMFLSVSKTLITLAVLIPAILFMYTVNVFVLGWWVLLFFAAAIMTGWWLGFISAGIVLRWGQKVQTVIWTLPGILLPFSAVFFPVDKMPEALQPFTLIVPTSYILEAMRAVIEGTPVNIPSLVLSFALNTFYVLLSIWYFKKSFEYSRTLGLNRFS